MTSEPYTPDEAELRDSYAGVMDEYVGQDYDQAKADAERGIAKIKAEARAEGARETARYVERIAPKGLVDRASVLADMEIAAERLERGIHANGRDRIEEEA